MRLIKWSLLIISVVSFYAAAQQVAQPTKEGVGIYKNEVRELYEEPMMTVGTADRLTVMDKKRDAFKVRTPDGQVGWVEKKSVNLIGGGKSSKTFVFDNAEVVGYLDNPTPVYIIDTDDPNADPISLDRSFRDALRENVDKETIERQVK